MEGFGCVGKRIPKIDAQDKVTGRSVYIQDLKVPGMLFGKILRSKYPHARIVHIDTSRARKLLGVRAVITAEDIPAVRFGFMKDQTALKAAKVRSYRDEVAAVAAIDPEIAEEALDLIEVEYESLPAVFDPEEAMREDAPLIHEENKTNILKLPWKLVAGDVEEARKKSAFVVEDRFKTTWVTHCCLGTDGVIADFDLRNNLTMYRNTQIPSLAQKDFNDALQAMGLKASKSRVIQPTIGGGFGSKLDTYAFEYIAILLAYVTRRPVKILNTREEEFRYTSTRQPAIIDIAQGCGRNGKLTFRNVLMILDNGAYTSWGATTPSVMMMPISSLYRVPNVFYEAKCVYTNNTWSQAMRGYGNPQATFAIDSNLDQLAHEAGFDPMEFRLINANEPGEVTPQRFKITTCGLEACIKEVGKKLGWEKRKKSKKTGARGFGMASLIHVGGGARVYKSDGCGTIIKIDDFGTVNVFTGATDIGQGAETVIAQMVAEEIGVLPEDVNIIDNDTDVCPWDVGVHASRTTFVAGNSAVMAARKVKEQIFEIAAGYVDRWKDKEGNKHETRLDEDPQNLVIRDRIVYSTREPEKKVDLGKILRGAHYSKGGTMIMAEYFYDPDNENLDREFKGNLSMTYAYGTHGVEVEVDKETGKVKIIRYIAAHDVGRAINPMLLEGQIYGAAAMGTGYALTERLILEKGEVMNANFRDYKLLTAKDVIPVEPIIIETIDQDGPYGAKGIGEPGCVPTAPAIANAIYDAIGVRIKDLPITPEKIVKALRQKQGETDSQ
ncbi:MAG: molybdopterin-dependent oxidoreductase [Proteobacteria bacterium]|nr:molybdopterin-dependent oxidoreductase [Pseudomonadota bacterium]NIS72056.1 molybdopterin-dependent oxidoreductase [Pseudomonadota bacterium]